MKILHYIPEISEPLNARNRMMLRLVTAVSKQVESCLVTYGQLSPELQNSLKLQYGVEILNLPRVTSHSPLQMYKAAKCLKKTLQTVQPDVVHIHGAWSPLLPLMERMADNYGCVTCVSPYGGMAPEILNIDFFKTKMLPLFFYQGPSIRKATSLIAIDEKEKKDIVNLNLKKRIEVLPQFSLDASVSENLITSLLAAYRKAIDSSYRRFLTMEEEIAVEQCVVAATVSDLIPYGGELSWDGVSFRRMFFYAYDEDVLTLIHDGAQKMGKNMPPLIDIASIPRYTDKKAKRRGALDALHVPRRRIGIEPSRKEEYHAVSLIMKAHSEGLKRLTLRHKIDIYNLFRNVDFDEDIVAKELKRLHLKRFTRKLQRCLHEFYGMPEGYDIF